MSDGKIFVFTGPTLSAEDAGEVLDVIYRPPASQGDVYKAGRQKPWGIGVIDGYFERNPAIWHKEILWALSRGIHVFGAASMGALRAAETAAFGMQGVGKIFRAFCDGELEGDDEVVVAHAPRSYGFCLSSEAMVNIRFTILAAINAGILSSDVGARLIDIGKQLFYPRRTWERILDLGRSRGLPDFAIDAFTRWLPNGRVDQKRQDALDLLSYMRERLEESVAPFRPSFTFQHTDAWENARREFGCEMSNDILSSETAMEFTPFEELQIGSDYLQVRDHLRARTLALENASLEGLAIDETLMSSTLNELRLELGLERQDDFDLWCRNCGLGLEALEGLIKREAMIRRVFRFTEAASLEDGLADYLRISGRYSDVMARFTQKRGVLVSLGLEDPFLEATGLTEDELWEWYFVEHLGTEPPDHLDRFAKAHGFAGHMSLLRAVIREYCYLRYLRESTLVVRDAKFDQVEDGTGSEG